MIHISIGWQKVDPRVGSTRASDTSRGKLLLVHVNAYGMPKHKARVVLATYEGTKVDWGTVTGAALREGLHAF